MSHNDPQLSHLDCGRRPLMLCKLRIQQHENLFVYEQIAAYYSY